jgi:hypothetical protein
MQEKRVRAADGLREPELLAKLRSPRTLLAVVAVAIVWLLVDAQRPEAKARGAAVTAAQQVCASARAIAGASVAGSTAKSD